MKQVYWLASKAAKVDFPVLIVGETGVGKDVLASIIHENSSRHQEGQLVSLNCSAIQDNLIESELFGYLKGAFTGASHNKIGLLKIADGGTLFLDELGEMSLDMQKKLLRVLESKEYFPIGSVCPEKSDFRLICATNVDLRSMVDQGTFRRDLYHRINVINIRIPPLKERIDEIADFVDYFLKELRLDYYKVSTQVLDMFLGYDWPGNIREIRNVLESAVALIDDGENVIKAEHLPMDRFGNNGNTPCYQQNMPLKDRERCFREALIRHALEIYQGDYKKVMELHGISKDMIYRAIGNHSPKPRI
ncbi:MAG: sigma-54 interaction domain-containing protein [bacterium]